MFFNYSKEEGWYMSYACISQTLGLHAFYLSSRSPHRSIGWIQERIGWANKTGLIDTTTGLAIADEQHWMAHCLGSSAPVIS